MDIESDDSERWEDFFGSSTELAPSLLGIYDTLTSSLDTSNTSSSSSCDTPNGFERINSTNNSNNTNNTSSSSNFSGKHSSLNEQQDNTRFELPTKLTTTTTTTLIPTLTEKQQHQQKQRLQLHLPLDVNTGGSYSRGKSSSAICQSLSSLSSNSSFNSSASGNSNSSGASSPSCGKLRDSISASSSSIYHSNSNNNKHRNNIRILSPNVQRIITHADAEPVHTVDIDALHSQQQQQPSGTVLSPVPQQRQFRKSPTPTSTNGHKVKLSNIPLSKITGKLTQSGSDLVETFDSSSEYLDALSFVTHDKKPTRSSLKKPPTPAILTIPGVDDEKTPTNSGGSPFSFDCVVGKARKLTLPKSELGIDEVQVNEMEPLVTPTNGQSNASTTSNGSTESNNKSNDFSIANESPQHPTELVEAINYSFTSKSIAQLTLTDKESKASISLISAELIEAINKPLISKPLVRSSSAACASTVAASPLLTYARSKSLAAKANTLGGPVPIKLPTAQQLEELEEASKMSAESLDRLTDIKSKFSPKESRKISVLMLPDIAKLKHRPLSSSSICSTSSSSSSGSDHLNGKLATSYLASVESLADQSENELMDPHSGMSVFERACMEFMDSERSYVEDLGQVIRGYLFDWKERACLSYEELRILFANIEDIYDFNSTLLKQLINSGMDPVKIAKCFIDLQERFDVYTTYCTSYPEAISLLTKLLQATHTNALLTSTQKMLQHTLPLGSYLLKPVQRILKYHLLLDNLRKHCDVKEVFQAYEIMRQVARNIDQVKRKLEQRSRVKELSGILDGWLGPELTVLGELRQEGLVLEHGKPRMVFLFDTMLIITKPKEDNRLQFKSYIHQNNLMLSEHLPGEPTSFYVIPYDEPRNQIKLTAKNRDQKRLWAQHIKGVILEKFHNIPNRAKELVYKLGDEEDRTPDKNTWKWSLHSSSSSTPVYLERRNQYRRSEMRNRTKLKRKTVANSSSFESFNELAEQTKDAPIKPTKPLSRNNSLDESMLPALQKIAAAVRSKNKHDSIAVDANDKNKSTGNEKDELGKSATENGACKLRDKRVTVQGVPKSPLFGGRALKERSKSVPRISFQAEDLEDERKSLHGSNTNLDGRKSKSTKPVEVKQYNHKTLPKRIANLKKQRTSKKETSKFYMDLTDLEETTDTVLKITESTENLLEKQDIEQAEECKEDTAVLPDVVAKNERNGDGNARDAPISPAEKAKKDAQIILDLLKNNKEFEKIYNKPHKKRSFDSSTSMPTSPEPQELVVAIELPPRPPSRSPPPLELESGMKKADPSDGRDEECGVGEGDGNDNEPIYESLLRNVHVPYKFSPVLSRNKPVQLYKPREKKAAPLPRPESDYVMLVYSPEGALQKVGEVFVQREPQLRRSDMPFDAAAQRDSSGSSSSSSSATVKRDSQNTVISVECNSSGNISELSTSTTEAIYTRPMPKNLMKRLLSGGGGGGNRFSPENACNSEMSLLPRARKSIDNISLAFGVRSNKPPERRSSDVSEMCRQSILHRQGSEAVGERMAHVDYADPRTLFGMTASEASLQRDSVFSLTSSNDSVCDYQKRSAAASMDLPTSFEYEDDVEACLENDFRDSAIYSDDNDKRNDYETIEFVKRPTSPPPPPPLAASCAAACAALMAKARQYPPQIPPKPTRIPPPSGVKSPTRHSNHVGERTGIIICPPHLNAAASRSWVLQQIENFNK